MSAAIAHRGPDDSGIWSDERAALAIRRLSIIDLAGGHQPMVSPSGKVIVFNGEIYNYRRLREELVARGYEFRTDSDTEVVLALFELDGPGSVERLEGMFAYCVYDPRRRTAHLVRDRFGKKPLYVGTEGGRLWFASEIKALLPALNRRPALDRTSLHHYLSLRYVPGPRTIWEGIRKLEPGSSLTYDLDSDHADVRSFWHLSFQSQPEREGRDYVAEFEELFLEAVDKRLTAADVPVGVLLSGGLDSSAVSAAAVELGHRHFHTFSVGFRDDPDSSELDHARRLAEHIGSVHHEVTIGRDEFIGRVADLVVQTDEPLADLASIPLNAVSELAREHVKVVLSGEGADEVLAGYQLESLAASLERLRAVGRVPRPLLRLAAGRLPRGRGRLVRGVAAGGWSGSLAAAAFHMTGVFDEAEKARLWAEGPPPASTRRLIEDWYVACASAHPLDQFQEVHCGSWLVEDLLMKADKMSMAASLELRTPFLDHRLAEWAARLPLRWKVGDARAGWSSKRILRDFADGRVPRSTIERPKRGFPVPAYGWLRGETGRWAAERLKREGPLAELFDVSALGPVVTLARGGDLRAAHQVWTMLVLDEWLERWL